MRKQIIHCMTSIIAIICITLVVGCAGNHDTSPLPGQNVDQSGPVSAVIAFAKAIATQKTDDWIAGLLARGVSEQTLASVDTQVSNIKTTLVSQSEKDAVVEVTYHVELHMGTQSIQSSTPAVEMNIKPQTIKWDLYETMELTNSAGVWVVSNYFNGPASEKLSTELKEIQGAVRDMLGRAQMIELDSAYNEIDTQAEAESVTAKNGFYRLSNFYQPYKYSYAQAYDIAKDGTVTVHQP